MKPTPDRETRAFKDIELRADSDGPTIVGHAAVFNTLSEDLGGFHEMVAPTAFARALRGDDDVRALINHDRTKVIGRLPKTLQLEVDDVGLRVTIHPPDTSDGKDIVTSIRRGDIDGMSIGFHTIAHHWETRDGKEVRHLDEAELFEVSPVTFPAFPDTDVAVRSLERWKSRDSKPDQETRERRERAKDNAARCPQKGVKAMDDVTALEEERLHLVRSQGDMTKKAGDEKRAMTAEERAEFDELDKKITQLDEAITAAEETEDRAQRAHDRMEQLKAPKPRKTPYPSHRPQSVSDDELPEFDHRFLKFGKTQVFTKENFGANADAYAYRAGQWACAAILNRPSAQRWCKSHGIELRAMSTNVNTAGGVLVPDEMEQAIIIMREEYGVARRECRIVPMGSDTLLMPRWTDGLTAYYVGESGSVTASQPSFDNVRLTARKLATLTQFSTELSEDAIVNIGDFLATEIARAFAGAEDNALFNGDGTNTYGGITGARVMISQTSTLKGWVEAVAPHNLITEIDIDDLLLMMAVLPEYAQANAKWFCSPAFYYLVFMEIMEAGGGQTFATYEGGARGRVFLGYPVVVSPYMPNVAATDYDTVTMCLFGDMRQAAYLGDRRGITILPSDQRYIEYDQIGVRGTERYDINVHGIGDATNAGPIVGLIGNSV